MTRRELISTRQSADDLLLRHEPVVLRERVTEWLNTGGRKYSKGVDSHGSRYTPSSWQAIKPWSDSLSSRDTHGFATVTRGQVVDVARRCAEVGSWEELLVAAYVWGYGPRGYGPRRLERVLRNAAVGRSLIKAVSELGSQEQHEDSPPVRAYRVLSRGENHIGYCGPAFFTKVLYFAGKSLAVNGSQPLILDAVMAGVVRDYVADLLERHGGERGAAARVWRSGGWTPYRYGVYLSLMQQVVDGTGWTADQAELALFRQEQSRGKRRQVS